VESVEYVNIYPMGIMLLVWNVYIRDRNVYIQGLQNNRIGFQIPTGGITLANVTSCRVPVISYRLWAVIATVY
jgi:hypothetical protein